MKLRKKYLEWKLKRSLEKNPPMEIKLVRKIWKLKEYMGRYQIVYQDVEAGEEPEPRSWMPLHIRYSMNGMVWDKLFIKDWYKTKEAALKDLKLYREGEKLIDVE